MNRIPILLIGIFLLVACKNSDNLREDAEPAYQGPIRLLPENPHYFEYKGKPLVLVTSAEHYGALLNGDFDFHTYFQTLAEAGMNYSRVFAGTYAEIPGESFGIQYNTLAPQPDQFVTPWAYTLDETNKRIYDLDKWNEAYFIRLHELMEVTEENDIIIEFTFFTSIYRDDHWDISPENPENNINIKESVSRFQAHTPDNRSLLAYQEKLVRKLVRELNRYDHIFFEIQNEPWADHNIPVYNIVNKEELLANDWTYKVDFASDASLQWQNLIAEYITDEEADLDKKHLIAQNYCNYKAPLANINDNISILNFHYAWPEAVEWNYGHQRVIGFDESGFAGSGDQVYRRQAWRFLLSGGGLFNNLDYSFYTGFEDGSLDNKAPGGGSKKLRDQLRILSEFMHDLDLTSISPDPEVVRHAPGIISYVLSDRVNSYAIYLQAVGVNEGNITLEIPSGTYWATWISTISGEVLRKESVESTDGQITLSAFFENGEIAIKIGKNLE
jgi:hypothetical protein